MNIAVTGGMGFIGHYVCKILQNDYNVVSIDSKTTYGVFSKRELDFLLLDRFYSLENTLTMINDIRDSAVGTIFEKENIKIVIHLAAFPRAKVVDSNPKEASDVMITGLINLLEQAKKHKIRRFVYVSSSMVYGDFRGSVDESYPCNPKGIYGILKLAGERIVQDFCLRNDIEYVILRPSAVYGPRDVLDRVVSKFFYNAYKSLPLIVNGIDEELDFTYVSEVARGIAVASVVNSTVNKTYNITRGHARKIITAAEIVKSMVENSRSEILIKPKNDTYPSRGTLVSAKAEDDFGFTPEIDIEQGFRYYYEWLNKSNFFNAIV